MRRNNYCCGGAAPRREANQTTADRHKHSKQRSIEQHSPSKQETVRFAVIARISVYSTAGCLTLVVAAVVVVVCLRNAAVDLFCGFYAVLIAVASLAIALMISRH